MRRCHITFKKDILHIYDNMGTFFANLQPHYNNVIMSSMASQITSLTIVYSTVYSSGDQRRHQSSASLDFVWGIHRWPVNSPHKGPVTRKMFPFDDVIMSWKAIEECNETPPCIVYGLTIVIIISHWAGNKPLSDPTVALFTDHRIWTSLDRSELQNLRLGWIKCGEWYVRIFHWGYFWILVKKQS